MEAIAAGMQQMLRGLYAGKKQTNHAGQSPKFMAESYKSELSKSSRSKTAITDIVRI